MPFTITQDFEGDQFTFFKFPLEDLELLYGVVVQEHSIFESLETHVENQVKRGHTMLVEVDAWHLPDTRGISYRRQHTKTTIGIDVIDRHARQVGYFHNSGYYWATGADYDGLFDWVDPAKLSPYVECAKRRFTPLDGAALRDASLSLLRRHLLRRPITNPVAAFRQVLTQNAQEIAA